MAVVYLLCFHGLFSSDARMNMNDTVSFVSSSNNNSISSVDILCVETSKREFFFALSNYVYIANETHKRDKWNVCIDAQMNETKKKQQQRPLWTSLRTFTFGRKWKVFYYYHFVLCISHVAKMHLHFIEMIRKYANLDSRRQTERARERERARKSGPVSLEITNG